MPTEPQITLPASGLGVRKGGRLRGRGRQDLGVIVSCFDTSCARDGHELARPLAIVQGKSRWLCGLWRK
jgi:hypothetical protein